MLTRVVVTGGAGFIGANLVDRLIDDGAEVLVIDDLSTGKLQRLSDARRRGHVQIHQMNVCAAELGELIDRFEPQTVFHLAAVTEIARSVDDPVADASINLLGTINVLSASAASGAERVVFASSGGAVVGAAETFPTPGDAVRRPQSPFGVSKSVADSYLHYFWDSHGLDFVSLGLADIYGPRQNPQGENGLVARITRQLVSGQRPVIAGDGSERRDYVFVEDATDAFVRAAEIGGAAYLNIGSGRDVSVNELVAMLQQVAGTAMEPVYVDAVPGAVDRVCLDATAARKHLGWESWTTLEAGLAQTVASFRGGS
jgi:UDP-glucose 4-epimerase